LRQLITTVAATVVAMFVLSQFLVAGDQDADEPFVDEASEANPFGTDEGNSNPFSNGNTKENLKTQNARAIEEMLDKSCKRIDFTDTSLQDVIQILREQHDIMNIVLDEAALDEAGIDPEGPITINLNGVSLRSALRLMLRGLCLTHEVRDEVLLITTNEAAEMLLTTAVIPVHDVLSERDPLASATALIETVIRAAEPDSWEEAGGPATISYYQGNLIVAQNQQGHETVADNVANSFDRQARK